MNNPQTASQNHQVADWHQAVQAYRLEHPQARAIDIAAAVGCTEAFALSFLSEQVWQIPAADLPKVLAEIKTWERVMALIRNGEAVAEIEVPGHIWYLNGDWLNWIDEGYNLHIRAAATDHMLALIRSGKRGPTYSFNLVNEAGQVFCRFYARTAIDKERFGNFCAHYQLSDRSLTVKKE
jgi:putative heme degradation protein